MPAVATSRIINTVGAGGTKYWDCQGEPYTNVVNPNQIPNPSNNEAHLQNIDRTRQPRDAFFITHDYSAFKSAVVSNGDGQGLAQSAASQIGLNSKGIAIVKTRNYGQYHTYHRLFNSDMRDTPFIIYGGMNFVRGGRRLNGSIPAKRPTQMWQNTQTIQEFDLVDPRNPFVVRVKRHRQSTRFMQESKMDQFIVHRPAPMLFQNVLVDRSFEPLMDPATTWNQPHIASVEMNPVGLNLDVKVLIGYDSNALVKYTINWGEGAPRTDVASGLTITHRYTTTGIKTVTITAEQTAEATAAGLTVDTTPRVFKPFVHDLSWQPAPLAWSDIKNSTPADFVVSVVGRTVNIHCVVEGGPTVVMWAKFNDDTGSLQGTHSFKPVSFDMDKATFEISHNFGIKHGSFVVELYAEHLGSKAIEGTPGSFTTPMSQRGQRSQIRRIQSIKIV